MRKLPILYTVLCNALTIMYKNTLISCKNQLRRKYKALRRNIDVDLRQKYNEEIFKRVIACEEYKNADTIFVYVSFGNEADTLKIIEYSLKQGKKVAVPYCIPNTCFMDFYYINSLDELKKGTFGVLEPVPENNVQAEVKQGLMLVPGLAFDEQGYRMGYGKGYYDRYLTDFCGVRIGLCYSCCLKRCILHNRYDKKVDYIISDNFTKFIAK